MFEDKVRDVFGFYKAIQRFYRWSKSTDSMQIEALNKSGLIGILDKKPSIWLNNRPLIDWCDLPKDVATKIHTKRDLDAFSLSLSEVREGYAGITPQGYLIAGIFGIPDFNMYDSRISDEVDLFRTGADTFSGLRVYGQELIRNYHRATPLHAIIDFLVPPQLGGRKEFKIHFDARTQDINTLYCAVDNMVEYTRK